MGVGDGAETEALLRLVVEVAVTLFWANARGSATMANVGTKRPMLVIEYRVLEVEKYMRADFARGCGDNRQSLNADRNIRIYTHAMAAFFI